MILQSLFGYCRVKCECSIVNLACYLTTKVTKVHALNTLDHFSFKSFTILKTRRSHKRKSKIFIKTLMYFIGKIHST